MKFYKSILAAALLFLGGAAHADTTTTRLGLTKPSAGSTGWGTKWNTNADTIDNAAGTTIANTFTAAQSFQGTVLSTSGAASAVGYGFIGATNYGWYQSAPTVIDLSINGTRSLEFDALQANFFINAIPNTSNGASLGNSAHTWLSLFVSTVQAAAGTLSIPSYGLSGTTGIGMYFPSTSMVAWAASGAQIASGTANGVAFRGTNTNDNASTGWIGEYISSTSVANGAFGTSGQYFDVVSISLTAGDWDITGLARFNPNSATSTGNFILAISTTSGNSSGGLTDGDNQVAVVGPVSGVNASSPVIPNYRASISASKTYYLKVNGTYTTATPQVGGARLSARRVR